MLVWHMPQMDYAYCSPDLQQCTAGRLLMAALLRCITAMMHPAS